MSYLNNYIHQTLEFADTQLGLNSLLPAKEGPINIILVQLTINHMRQKRTHETLLQWVHSARLTDLGHFSSISNPHCTEEMQDPPSIQGIKCQIPEDNWEKITNFEFEALQYCSLKTCECISSAKLIWFGSIQTLINNCLVQTLAINNCVVMSTTRPKIAIIHVLLHCDNTSIEAIYCHMFRKNSQKRFIDDWATFQISRLNIRYQVMFSKREKNMIFCTSPQTGWLTPHACTF